MNRTLLLASAVLLSVIAGVQTAMAQKVTLYSAGSKAYECDIAQLDSIVFSEGQTIIPDEEIIVTVDANGNVDGEHQFTRIDETTFLIDGLKYKFENGGLSVIGYDPVFFTGTAKVISKLIYNGRSMDVISIGGSAFENCSILTSITIPNSVTSIGEHAFHGCSGLTSITIPNSVISIGGYAFSGCIGLASITIPESVTNIGSGAFRLCSSLTSIIVESGNTVYDSRNNCNAIIETATNTLIAGCKNTTIPESVTRIGEIAFRGCTNLTSITIPSSVTRIDGSVFEGCTSLTSIIVESGNTIYDSRNNCNAIIKTATNTLVVGCKNTTIPESVTSISNYAFSGCSFLVSITIPNGVTSIDDSAFYNCSSLTSITIGSDVTNIGNRAFYGCSSLTDVYCHAEIVPSTDLYAFDGTPISSATLHVLAGSVSAYKAKAPWKSFRRIVAIE